MDKKELMRIIKKYLLFKINYKYYRCGYMGVNLHTPDDFYRPLRQWANIHEVSILAEIGQQAIFVLCGKYIHPKDIQIILDSE